MSRRNIPRPVIPSKTVNPARGRSAPDQQQQQKEKRQKLSEDIPPPNVSLSAPSEETDAEVEKLKKELADAKAAASSAEAEVKKLKEKEKEKLRQAYAKGYEAEIQRAALEYTQTAHKMVNDELEVRLPDFYRLRYASNKSVPL
ncbi:hypothetical protein RHGRI_012016 [Rhododendron griersonianum]|uniref:Uncharacterized protein n=1 Tax=Rhododendron griersonianum TaxID=479676 RepID=A0AAV6KNY5_9ERIC|nr:hypothetical protein RHGRI_012016 [Rhododendron griersonianum]